jgi:translation initiation factor 2 subunit 3
VVTETGRVVRLSPRHRVPIVSGRGTVWLDASSLVVGYDILLSNYARLIRYCDTGVLSGQNSLLSVERIESIDEEFYDGYLYDLSVPTYHNFVGGFGGFILHNTTIIEALTGIWTSSHSEELRRGITIRIGYADMPIYRFKAGEEEVYWSYPEFGGYSEGELVRVVSFVDCPGHESLMANMLSGATVMDGAMLVIAANESVPRPQTKEHAMALQILGVKSVVVVQNKLDLVSKEEARRNYEEIVEFLSTTEFADAPIIPVSAIHKVNLHYLVEALYRYIPLPKRDLAKPFRMYVIRSFDINKPGTRYRDLRGGVIGGSILQGKVKIGDEIEILPGYLYSEDGRIINKPLYANVQSIRTQHASLKEAYGGGLIGIQTDLDPYLTKSDNLVGNIAGEPGSLPPVRNEFDMEYELFKYVVGTDETIEVKPLSVNERLRLNVGPAVTLGIVTSIGPDNIHVRLHRPVVAEEGWRVAIATRVNNMWRLVGVGSVV